MENKYNSPEKEKQISIYKLMLLFMITIWSQFHYRYHHLILLNPKTKHYNQMAILIYIEIKNYFSVLN